jgi:alpha-methylacyl-CoA racemase
VLRESDGRYVAVGALEPRFFAALLDGLEIPQGTWSQQDRSMWPLMQSTFADIFRTRTPDEWTAIFAGSEACVTPVLTLLESREDPHLKHRGTFVNLEGVVQPGAAPRLSASKAAPGPRCGTAEHTETVLVTLGYDKEQIAALLSCGAAFARPRIHYAASGTSPGSGGPFGAALVADGG